MASRNEPLGLPAGSIRALLTAIMLVTVCVLSVMKEPVPDILRDAFLMAIGMYFGARGGKLPTVPVEVEEK